MATNAVRLGTAITGVLVAMGADPTLAAPIGLQFATAILDELTNNAEVDPTGGTPPMASPSGAVTGKGKIT